MAIDLDELNRTRDFYSSSDFIISCGTVTMDLKLGKVLLIYNRKLKIYQLPKGRKNIGEDLLTAALRETYEESGVRASALPLKVGTRATPAKGIAARVQLTTDVANTEPVAVCHFPCPVSGCMKMVFYFAAQGDSTAPAAVGTQEDWEKFQAEWKPAREAAQLLRFTDDSKVVLKAVEDAMRSGAMPRPTDPNKVN